MTKKAAKKKQARKQTKKKAASGEAPASAEQGGEGEAGAPPEAEPKAEIEVVEESAPAAKKKSGRGKRPDSEENPRSRSGSSRRGRRGGGARPPVDPEELGRKAWKVFQQEIAEEGLALIDEISARQLAEKSIVVTRAFLEERERRFGKGKAPESKGDAGPPAQDPPEAEE